MPITRRTFLQSTTATAASSAASQPLNVIIIGGHPGDPECGCAGTAARYVALGHHVALLYLNRGEGYCGPNPLDRCAGIRTAEAKSACASLRAKPVFAAQHDGQAIVDNPHYDAFSQLLAAESPDVVFTHWPIDLHRDHRAASALTLDAWIKFKNKFALYYYEVADDTLSYPTPTDYVDISPVEALRHAACYAHASQQPEKWYPKQVDITRARGAASGHTQAEAFVRHAGSKAAFLP